MRKLSKILLIFCSIAIFATGCIKSSGNNGDKKDGELKTLNIYISSSLISSKNDDNYVKQLIEEKFYEDRGYKIDLKVQVYGESDFNTVMSNKMAGNSWDAAVGYIGQAGIDEIMISQNVCMDIGDLIESYDNVYQLLKNNFEAVTTIDNKVYGVPSKEITNKYGALIRKDYMERVGYTSKPNHNDNLGAINEPPNGRKKTLVSIDDFTDMMRRMKAQGVCDYPLSGYPWDLEYTLTVGPFSNSSYMTKEIIKDKNGNVIQVLPGQLSNSYLKSITYEYMWAKEGLWEEEAYSGQKVNKLNAFVNGQTAIYTVDPEITNIINVARQTRHNNVNAELEILEPLYGVDENGNTTQTRGNLAKQESTSALVINKLSKNAEVLLEYLDWLAEDEANYNLATYGKEGEHWIKAGEGKYSYPENKKTRYETTPPYSGMYSLLKWEKFSYMVYDNYTEQEYNWINKVRNFPTFSNPCDNMLFIGAERDTLLNYQTAENDFFQDCLVKAWEGILDPRNVFSAEVSRYKSTASDYITWLTAQYNKYIVARN